jgi:hypothetical protein
MEGDAAVVLDIHGMPRSQGLPSSNFSELLNAPGQRRAAVLDYAQTESPRIAPSCYPVASFLVGAAGVVCCMNRLDWLDPEKQNRIGTMLSLLSNFFAIAGLRLSHRFRRMARWGLYIGILATLMNSLRWLFEPVLYR